MIKQTTVPKLKRTSFSGTATRWRLLLCSAALRAQFVSQLKQQVTVATFEVKDAIGQCPSYPSSEMTY
jgi:hypothetical protein